MSAHTPGPWKEYQSANKAMQFVFAGDGLNKCCAVCECYGPDKEANLRLIAAAPEMRALLQDMLDNDDPYEGVGGWFNEIRQVLTKATGEA